MIIISDRDSFTYFVPWQWYEYIHVLFNFDLLWGLSNLTGLAEMCCQSASKNDFSLGEFPRPFLLEDILPPTLHRCIASKLGYRRSSTALLVAAQPPCWFLDLLESWHSSEWELPQEKLDYYHPHPQTTSRLCRDLMPTTVSHMLRCRWSLIFANFTC